MRNWFSLNAFNWPSHLGQLVCGARRFCSATKPAAAPPPATRPGRPRTVGSAHRYVRPRGRLAIENLTGLAKLFLQLLHSGMCVGVAGVGVLALQLQQVQLLANAVCALVAHALGLGSIFVSGTPAKRRFICSTFVRDTASAVSASSNSSCSRATRPPAPAAPVPVQAATWRSSNRVKRLLASTNPHAAAPFVEKRTGTRPGGRFSRVCSSK